MTDEPRPYKHLDPLDLVDEISHQKHVVDLAVTFAERVATDPGNEADLQGLYYAVLRYQELNEEMELRYREQNMKLKSVS